LDDNIGLDRKGARCSNVSEVDQWFVQKCVKKNVKANTVTGHEDP
jgi:hypothetical protein